MTSVFSLYWLVLRRHTQLQNALILLSSYIFYGWWDWRFLGLIVLTTTTTFITALFGQRKHGRALTSLNILINVGILVTFKYFNFFSENITRLFSLFGIGLDWFTIDVLLPVGISFYTFQAIGYSVDVYKRRILPCTNPLVFYTFIAYFPQLVAGPIERASSLLPQIRNPRKWNTDEAVDGLRMILIGLVKKLCLADMAALYVERIFANTDISPLGVVIGGIVFSLEIYCDFSAYCEIARGVSQLLGIKLIVNFRFPYFSRNILEFWQRWHISLMEWFRDYIYIPLGGSRRGKSRTILNTFIIFILSGLWHGAAWNFILWGFYWSVFYTAAKFIFKQKRPKSKIEFSDLPDIVLTFGIASLGFYFFRCENAAQIAAGFKLGGLLYILLFAVLFLCSRLLVKIKWSRSGVTTLGAIAGSGVLAAIWIHPLAFLRFWWVIPALIVLIIEWRSRNLDYPLERVPPERYQRLILYWLCFLFIVLSEPTEMSFIYFQF